MIGLVDLEQSGGVAKLLERGGPPVRKLRDLTHALDVLSSRPLDALVVESQAGSPELDLLVQRAAERGVGVLIAARDQRGLPATEALRAGACEYLSFPFDLSALLASLERVRARPAGLVPARHGLPNRAVGAFITRDRELLDTLDLAVSVAASDATLLIQGESGTGKEVLARIIHRESPRRDRELVSINCAALPPGLLESELFGHERGAFTGALKRVIGKFELADSTTLLLDEIGELEPALQPKLLRVLQERQVQRIGAPRPVPVDFRLIATTNRDLASSVRSGDFRADLYYRLHVLPLELKPLRERRGDVSLLIDHFLRRSARHGRKPPILPSSTLDALVRHRWPGNVRELEHTVERLTLTHAGRRVESHELGLDLPTAIASAPLSCRPARPLVSGARPVLCGPDGTAGPASPDASRGRSLREMEREHIVETLRRVRGNRTRAAKELEISLRTLRNKIHAYQIVEPDTLPRTGST